MTRFDFLREPAPEWLTRVVSVRLPQRFFAPAVVFAALLLAIVAAHLLEALRIRSATALEVRARERFERSRNALDRLHVQWQQIDELVTLDRRLRDVRLSGARIATGIARIGNAFPAEASARSVTLKDGAYAVKGRAVDLPAVEVVLARLLRERAVGAFDGNVQLARDGSSFGELTFDVHAGSAP